MATKNVVLLPLLVFVSSCVFILGFSQGLGSVQSSLLAVDDNGSGGGGGSAMPECMKKLLPCEQYLRLPVSPPATCCVPLKEMVSNDPKCLCDFFNNPVLLNSLNITQTDALKLPKACGSNVDVSICPDNATAPTGSTTAPIASSNSSSSSNSTTSTSAAHGNSLSYVFGLASILVAFGSYIYGSSMS